MDFESTNRFCRQVFYVYCHCPAASWASCEWICFPLQNDNLFTLRGPKWWCSLHITSLLGRCFMFAWGRKYIFASSVWNLFPSSFMECQCDLWQMPGVLQYTFLAVVASSLVSHLISVLYNCPPQLQSENHKLASSHSNSETVNSVINYFTLSKKKMNYALIS